MQEYAVVRAASVMCRIMPRHRFLRQQGILKSNDTVSLSTAMLVGDEKFAVTVAKSSLAEYEAFRIKMKYSS